MSVLTQDILNSIEKRYNRRLPKVFIETGTFKGETIAHVADVFPVIHTFELDEKWYREAVSKFKEQKHINCHYGDSAEGLKKVLPEINEPVVFWLDAHYCGPETSFGIEEVSLLRELAIIAPRKQKDIIIIDDAFLLGIRRTFEYENIPPFECNWENITAESIKKAILWEPNHIMVRYNDDILIIFTNLTVSDVLQISESEINDLNQMLSSKKSEINQLNQILSSKESRINQLNQILSSKESRINSLESQRQQMQRSIVMQLVNRYQRIVEKLLHRGTRRRHYYELGLAGIRVILNEGWRAFWHKFRQRYKKKHDEAKEP